MSTPIILLTAATGTQSSSLIRALSAWSSSTRTAIVIHGTSRDPSASAVQDLIGANTHSKCTVNMFKADYDDPGSLTAPAIGATHAFINVMPVMTDMSAEAKHASSILEALRSAASDTLQRIVYSSVHSLKDPSIPGNFKNLEGNPWMHAYYTSKFRIEESVVKFAQSLSIPYTLLQPGMFLTNLVPPHSNFLYPDLAAPGENTIRTALKPTNVFGWLDPEDIGTYALRALVSSPSDSEEYQTLYQGKKVPIAAHSLTLSQAVDSLNAYLKSNHQKDSRIPPGTLAKIDFISEEVADAEKMQNPLIAAQLFQNDNQGAFRFDPALSEKYGIEAGSVEAFWIREGKAGRVAAALGYA